MPDPAKTEGKRLDTIRAAEFWDVIRFLNERDIKLSRGWDGDPVYMQGHRLRTLADDYARGGNGR